MGDKSHANSRLQPRQKRANSGEEAFTSGDLQRECIEELCNWEEFKEIKENVEANVRSNDYETNYKKNFETFYAECHKQVVDAQLDDSETVDMRPNCMVLYEFKIKDIKEFFEAQNNGSVDV